MSVSSYILSDTTSREKNKKQNHHLEDLVYLLKRF